VSGRLEARDWKANGEHLFLDGFPVNLREEALALRKFFSTALTLNASAIAFAPSTPMLLPSRKRVVTTALTFSASAIALAPSSPIVLPPSQSSVRTLLKTPFCF
jgi:hypothetical protein